MNGNLRSRFAARVAAAGRGDDGSLVIAVMIAISVLSMSLLLVGATLSSAYSTRNTQSFTAATQAADAGIQDAVATMNAGFAPATEPSAPKTVTRNGATFSWYAIPDDAGDPNAYTVYSTGTYAKNTKQIVAELTVVKVNTSGSTTTTPGPTPDGPFKEAVFGDLDVTLRGSNVIRSYTPGSPGAWNTGVGSVGTNGALVLRGNATTDKITLWNSPSSTCNGFDCLNPAKVTAKPQPFRAETAFITTALASPTTGSGCGPNPPTYVASRNGPIPAGASCWSSMLFDVDVTAGGTAASPSTVYVAGTISVGNGRKVNTTAATLPPNGYPVAANLLVYSAGKRVAIGNHTSVAWGLYAPAAICAGNPANAQADLFGSMVCKSISNQGGWEFNYDANMAATGYPGDTTVVTPPPGDTVNVWSAGTYYDGPR